jgi:hypothetical protein
MGQVFAQEQAFFKARQMALLSEEARERDGAQFVMKM